MDSSSERLTLHPFTVDQARRVIAGTPDPTDHWEGGYSFAEEIELVREFLQVVDQQGDPAPFGPYLIRRGEDGPAVGGITFFGPPDSNGVVEFGFALVPAVRGRGYATEAVKLAIVTARDGGARHVRAEADVDNTAAQRVLERAGMIETTRDDAVTVFELEL